MTPALLFRLAWGIWLLSWIVAAFWSSKATARSSAREGFTYGIPIFVGAWLLFGETSRLLQAARLWHVGIAGAWTLASLTIPCFLFAWWARIYLGDLWSAQITRKGDHRVVDTGPYAVVRHPIYTGLIAATFLTAAAKATLPAIAGAALIALGLWLKARLEERFLSEELGSDAYAAYRHKVPMLIPFAPR
jgi:protein-S-isoprenylcysteine O-methyltransferase Ste14